jgi:hypothetical protein
VTTAGFRDVHVYGIEGAGWLIPEPGFSERWADPEARQIILEVARLLESEQDLVAASAHLLVVGSA